MLVEFVPTISIGQLPEGEMCPINADGEFILLAKIDGEIYAIGDICSHFHTHLSSGELHKKRCAVQCPLHDSCFDLRTGEPLDPPADEPVPVYAVKIEGGLIYVGQS